MPPSCPSPFLAILQMQPELPGQCCFIYVLHLISGRKCAAGKPHPQWELCKPVVGCWFALVRPCCAQVQAMNSTCKGAALCCCLSHGDPAILTAKKGKGLWKAGGIQSSSHLGPRLSGDEVCKDADQGKFYSCILL